MGYDEKLKELAAEYEKISSWYLSLSALMISACLAVDMTST
jgi:hypothetical protein